MTEVHLDSATCLLRDNATKTVADKVQRSLVFGQGTSHCLDSLEKVAGKVVNLGRRFAKGNDRVIAVGEDAGILQSGGKKVP